MNDKMKGYKKEAIDPEDKAGAIRAEANEIEALETAEPELQPDPDTVVPTGDEDAPVTQPVHKSAITSLYDKSRKNRELVTREDAEGAPDVAMIQRLHAEASGGEVPEAGVDTNRPDRFEEEAEHHEPASEEEEAELAEALEDEIPEEEIVNEEEPVSLSTLSSDDRVSVKILGIHYDVPQQDIDDAGGLEAYQKNRAATIRLQRAATLERSINDRARRAQPAAQPQHEVADPSTDGHGEADIPSLRGEMMDVVIDGDEKAIDDWIEKRLTRAKAQPRAPQPATPPPAETVETSSEAQEELQAQIDLDIEETNAMMNEEFPDIMDGGKPNATELQRRRMADAQEYFRVLMSDPHNEGRTQKEMAREAAHRARRIRYPEEMSRGKVPPIEEERRNRIKRKRRMPQPSRADQPAPSRSKQEKKVPSRKEHLMRLRRKAGLDLSE